jgi:hypothetical protein
MEPLSMGMKSVPFRGLLTFRFSFFGRRLVGSEGGEIDL